MLALLPLPRRDVLSGAAAVAITGPQIAHAAESLLSASVALYTSDSAFVYEPAEEMSSCVRAVVGRSLDAATPDARLVVSFFPTSALADVERYHSRTLSQPLHLHFFTPTFFRGSSPAAAPGRYASLGMDVAAVDGLQLRRGAGIMCGAHGLTVGYELWASRFTSESGDQEHRSFGISGSTAGPLLAGSTDAPRPGPCVLHATTTPSMAQALATQLSEGEGGDPRVREALSLGVIRKPLYATAAEVLRVDRTYGAPAAALTRKPPA